MRGKAYLAAIVMHAAAFEAMLLAICCLYPKDVKATATYQRKKFRRKRDRALEFTLNQLINIANEAQWLPSKRANWGGKRADIAGFAHEARKIRNLVHPGLCARERTNLTTVTKGYVDVTCEIFDVANSWLLHRVEQNILKRMKAEERSKRLKGNRRSSG
jgi:hypothetical protein